MSVAKHMKLITPEEFEAMKKEKDFYYELMDDMVFKSFKPSPEHQIIASKLYKNLLIKVSDSAYNAIYEYNIKWKNNILRPDFMIYYKNNNEIPEIVFEIIDPPTYEQDYIYVYFKKEKYQEISVKEYWIIDAKIKSITVFDFVHDTIKVFQLKETISSLVIPEISIAVSNILA